MSKDEECNICVISDVSYPNPSSLIVFVGNLYDKSTMHFQECRLTLYFVIYLWVNIHLNSFRLKVQKIPYTTSTVSYIDIKHLLNNGHIPWLFLININH